MIFFFIILGNIDISLINEPVTIKFEHFQYIYSPINKYQR